MRGIKLVLEALGIQIDPVEIEEKWEQAKDALPKLALAFQTMEERQARLEEKVDRILASLASPYKIPVNFDEIGKEAYTDPEKSNGKLPAFDAKVPDGVSYGD